MKIYMVEVSHSGNCSNCQVFSNLEKAMRYGREEAQWPFSDVKIWGYEVDEVDSQKLLYHTASGGLRGELLPYFQHNAEF